MPTNLSRKQLDALYSPSTLAPGFREVLAEYRAASDRAKQSLPCELGVPYGDGPDEALHFFPPLAAPSPVHVFVHGGHWQELSIDDSCFAAAGFVEQGAGFVAVGYQLAPQGTLDGMAASVTKALDWVKANAERLGTTPDSVYASGSSAGAHLLAMALTRTDIAGAALLSGTYDLSLIPHTYVNDALGLDDAAAARNSPVDKLPLRAADVIVARGGHETAEYARQHDLLVDALRRHGRPAASIVCIGRNHFDLPLHLADPADELGVAVLRQMGLRA